MADTKVAGSFRDPSGYVINREGKIYRALDQQCHGDLQALRNSGLLQRLMDEGLLVGTSFVPDGHIASALAAENPGFTHFVEHERIEFISHPYEWSVSMLAAAAITTLDMQIALAGAGFTLKDASAYNVQFRGGKPVFIDLGSIQRAARQDIWFALGQFQRHFLFPLLLVLKRGWDLRSYFLPNLDGIAIAQVARNFRGLSRWSPGLLMDLTLPAIVERNASAKTGKTWEESKRSTGGSVQGQLLNLRRLRKKISSLAKRYQTGGAWHDYTSTCTYDQTAEASKKKQIEAFLAQHRPATALDLGCNTGDYSYLAAGSGAQVIAADADHDSIELLYRRLCKSPAPIQPIVLNAANPSPAIGYQNSERTSFLNRAPSECVLSLALIHHLLVSANLDLARIRDLLRSVCTRHLILEFVPVDDIQFQRLLRYRENLFANLTLDECLTVFGSSFDLIGREVVEGTGRTLLFFSVKP